MFVFFFFFSSRRRHTRLVSDWSSDVCSSDLSLDRLLFRAEAMRPRPPALESAQQPKLQIAGDRTAAHRHAPVQPAEPGKTRSEERRVGKECRTRRRADREKRRTKKESRKKES